MNTAHIVTLTMNPALDISTAADEVVPIHKVRCEPPRYDPGSGGINVARVVTILGGTASAVYPAGGPAGKLLEHLLAQSGIRQRVIAITERTRENFTVDERSSGEQYRFVLPGPVLSQGDAKRCLDALRSLAPAPKFLVASGSLPPGVASDFYAKVAGIAHETGTKLLLDTSGVALRNACREGAYLVKPNLRELSQYVGRALEEEEERLGAARQMLEDGAAEVIVLSLGHQGAMLVTADEAVRFGPLRVPVRSAVGAGDSMVGGIVFALARGDTLREAVRLGMAAGSAALITEGTALCRREDVERLYREAMGSDSEINPRP